MRGRQGCDKMGGSELVSSGSGKGQVAGSRVQLQKPLMERNILAESACIRCSRTLHHVPAGVQRLADSMWFIAGILCEEPANIYCN